MTSYRPASAVRTIAEDLIPKHHDHLVDVRIEYVFRDKAATSKGKTVWGRARKVSGLNAYLAALRVNVSVEGFSMSDVGAEGEDFFVIEIAEDVWSALTDEQRVALVDHELCHCVTEVDNDDELKLGIRGHDVEEFRSVIERHGFWRPDVVEFAKSVEQQLTLDI